MIAKIKNFLNTLSETDEKDSEDDYVLAIASLFCEVCNADQCITNEETNTIRHTLVKMFAIDNTQANDLISSAQEQIKAANSLYEFSDKLRGLSAQMRINLISAMWEVAYADNELDPIEEMIIRKVAQLIYVNHNDFIRTKLAVIAQKDS